MNASVTFGVDGRAVRIALYPLSWHVFMQGPSQGFFSLAIGPFRFLADYGKSGVLA